MDVEVIPWQAWNAWPQLHVGMAHGCHRCRVYLGVVLAGRGPALRGWGHPDATTHG